MWVGAFRELAPDLIEQYESAFKFPKRPAGAPRPDALDLHWSTLGGLGVLEKYLSSDAPRQKKIVAALALQSLSLILDEDRTEIIDVLSQIRNDTQDYTTKLWGLLQDIEAGPMVLCASVSGPVSPPVKGDIYQCTNENSPIINITKLAKKNPTLPLDELRTLFSQDCIVYDLQKLIDQDLLLWQPLEYVLANVPRVTEAAKKA